MKQDISDNKAIFSLPWHLAWSCPSDDRGLEKLLLCEPPWWMERSGSRSEGVCLNKLVTATAFSSGLQRIAGQRVLAALANSWFQERGVFLEITSFLLQDVVSLLLSGMQLKSNLELSDSARLETAMQGMCWTECEGHVFNVMLDAAMWVLLYASNQILDTTSSSKVISSYCLHLRSQNLLDGFAPHSLEYQNWNYRLCVNLWSRDNIIAAHLLHYYVHTRHQSSSSSKKLGFGIQRLHNGLNADVSTNLELIFRSIMASTIVTHERYFLCCFSCTCLSLSIGSVEDAVSVLFGLCHRRCTTTPPLLIPRFDSGDPLSLSSVKDIRHLQLNSIPRVHIPDRPSGEPPAGHQLDRTVIEALEDCRCGNFESGLSTDE